MTLLFRESPCLSAVVLCAAWFHHVFFVVFAFLLYFYRYPPRDSSLLDPRSIVSPCDGTILKIEKIQDVYHIKVFLSIWDVHVQWYPVDGRVQSVQHHPGQFNVAYILEKSDYNEKTSTVIQNERGTIRVDQIAGQVANRIVNKSVQDTQVKRGDYMGMIKLSSRVDVFLPASKVKLLCRVKDKVIGNGTVLATFN